LREQQSVSNSPERASSQGSPLAVITVSGPADAGDHEHDCEADPSAEKKVMLPDNVRESQREQCGLGHIVSETLGRHSLRQPNAAEQVLEPRVGADRSIVTVGLDPQHSAIGGIAVSPPVMLIRILQPIEGTILVA
jgi:hypothetical protein